MKVFNDITGYAGAETRAQSLKLPWSLLVRSLTINYSVFLGPPHPAVDFSTVEKLGVKIQKPRFFF